MSSHSALTGVRSCGDVIKTNQRPNGLPMQGLSNWTALSQEPDPFLKLKTHFHDAAIDFQYVSSCHSQRNLMN